MKRLIVIGVVLLCAALAGAEVTVEITGVEPSDGVIASGEVATVYWKIEATEGESGTYRVEIGGDGTPESGELASSDDATGSFSGNLSSSTDISADEDLTEGDGEYTIYVIAIYGEGKEDFAFASTTIKLDNPPQKPEGFSVGSGEKRLFLSWNTPEDKDLEYVYICYDTESHTGEDVTCEDYEGTGAKDGNSPIKVDYSEDSYILKGLENGTKYYVRIVFEDEGGKQGEPSDEKSGVPENVEGLAELTGEEGGCFVATVLFGEKHFVTNTYRSLRDKFLVKHGPTRELVKLYYRYGPDLAGFVSRHPALKPAFQVPLALGAAAIAPIVGTAPAASCPLYIAAVIGLVGCALLVLRRKGK